MSQSPPLEIVIAGGGTAGWMAAAALSRFLGPAGRITLVESEAIGTVGVGEATIPQIHLFVGGLGLHEAELVRETRATYKLGIEFDGWLGEGHRYMHAFGMVGRAAGIIPFRQLWHRARAEEIRTAELAKVRVSDDERRTLESVTQQILNKLLNLPTVRMKEAAVSADGAVYADAVKHLFGLEDERRP